MIRLALFVIGFLLATVTAFTVGPNGLTLLGCVMAAPQIVHGAMHDPYITIPTFRKARR
jgi:disulfide bond formation protein DsbB